MFKLQFYADKGLGMTALRVLFQLTLALLLSANIVSAADFQPLTGQAAVRVCADAHNLPYSNDKLEGFDNKIAAIIGEELGLPVEYYWFPQRIGFGRNTIKKVDPETGKFLCDLAMSIPNERGLYTPTDVYFSSIDAMVYRKGEGYELSQISDIAKVSKQGKKLKVGLFDRATATQTLLENGLEDQIEYFQMMTGDARINSGRIVSEALASGQVDVAFAWGPIAAYYASASEVSMTVVPLNEVGSDFIFSFSMGVRHQDKAWKELLNKIIAKRKGDIDAIIAQYNMPSLANVKQTIKKKPVIYTVENGKVDDKTYLGWRLFNSSCYVCHGKNATGTERGPNLLPVVKDMSGFRFRKKVLRKYFSKYNLDVPERRLALLSQIPAEHARGFEMPVWDEDPYIRPHINDLYAYLKARADGALGEEKPERLVK